MSNNNDQNNFETLSIGTQKQVEFVYNSNTPNLGNIAFDLRPIARFGYHDDIMSTVEEVPSLLSPTDENIDDLGSRELPFMPTVFRNYPIICQGGGTCSVFALFNCIRSLGKEIPLHEGLVKIANTIYEGNGSFLEIIVKMLDQNKVDLSEYGIKIAQLPFPSIIPTLELLSPKIISNNKEVETPREKSKEQILIILVDRKRAIDKLILDNITNTSVIYFGSRSSRLIQANNERQGHAMAAVGKRSNEDGTVSIQIVNSHGKSYWVSYDLFVEDIDKIGGIGIVSVIDEG